MDAFTKAIAAIDEANACDPNELIAGERRGPKELVHAAMMTEWVERLAPEASPALRLAARAHHLRRWEMPRSSYAEGRHAYLRWREDLHRFHARELQALLAGAGLDAATSERAAQLVAKRAPRGDAEAQVLEDALCLVFLETQFAGLATKLDPAKLPDVVRKTWRKMSPPGQAAAVALPMPAHDRDILLAALGDEA
ncbi:MAG: DUF4202 domain-containing protein [Dehalococcoidia bacterium]